MFWLEENITRIQPYCGQNFTLYHFIVLMDKIRLPIISLIQMLRVGNGTEMNKLTIDKKIGRII